MAVSPLDPNMWDFGSKVAEYWVRLWLFFFFKKGSREWRSGFTNWAHYSERERYSAKRLPLHWKEENQKKWQQSVQYFAEETVWQLSASQPFADRVNLTAVWSLHWEGRKSHQTASQPFFERECLTAECQSALHWKRMFGSWVSIKFQWKRVRQQSVNWLFSGTESLAARCQSACYWKKNFDSKVSFLYLKSLTAKCHPFTERVWQQSVIPSPKEFDSKVWTLHCWKTTLTGRHSRLASNGE